jgi:hypothetical protein
MILVGIFGRSAAACLLAAWLVATPALSRADGVMLVQAGAFWMGRDDGAPDEAPRIGSTCATSGSIATR